MNSEPLRQIQWIKFRNDAGSTAPAGGVLRVTGYNDDAEEPFLTIDQSNTFGAQYNHAINDDLDVASGDYGYCCLGAMVPALYDSADGTPAWGELWGPRSGSWKLKKNTGGFRIACNSFVGVAADYRTLIRPEPFIRFHGVTDAAIAKDASGTVSIFYGTGAGTDSTVNMSSVYNSYGDVAITKDVECLWDGDMAGTSWRIIAAEC